jgi:hypothetical protein
MDKKTSAPRDGRAIAVSFIKEIERCAGNETAGISIRLPESRDVWAAALEQLCELNKKERRRFVAVLDEYFTEAASGSVYHASAFDKGKRTEYSCYNLRKRELQELRAKKAA